MCVHVHVLVCRPAAQVHAYGVCVCTCMCTELLITVFRYSTLLQLTCMTERICLVSSTVSMLSGQNVCVYNVYTWCVYVHVVCIYAYVVNSVTPTLHTYTYSLYLHKLGKAPLIEDLLGTATFTGIYTHIYIYIYIHE